MTTNVVTLSEEEKERLALIAKRQSYYKTKDWSAVQFLLQLLARAGVDIDAAADERSPLQR